MYLCVASSLHLTTNICPSIYNNDHFKDIHNNKYLHNYVILIEWTAVTCTKFVECTLVIPYMTNHSRGKALAIYTDFC